MKLDYMFSLLGIELSFNRISTVACNQAEMDTAGKKKLVVLEMFRVRADLFVPLQ